MTIVYSKEDRIPLKIDSIVVTISPLSALEKAEVQPHLVKAVNGDMASAVKGAQIAIKYAVKGIEGVKTFKGDAYSLEFDDSGNLTDKCVDDLLNLEQNNKLTSVCTALINGVPSQIIDPFTGEEMEGVSFIREEQGLPEVPRN